MRVFLFNALCISTPPLHIIFPPSPVIILNVTTPAPTTTTQGEGDLIQFLPISTRRKSFETESDSAEKESGKLI
jgi:hypothetical protein